MPSYYEINVTLNGYHLFATAQRSIQSEHKLREVLAIFMNKFPESEGYSISATYWDCVGQILNIGQNIDLELDK